MKTQEHWIRFKDGDKIYDAIVTSKPYSNGYITLLCKEFKGSWFKDYQVEWLGKNIIKKWKV